jgi:NADH dehydrogenase FAD-containing subunit
MAWDKLRFARKILPLILSYTFEQLTKYIRGIIHKRTYTAGPNPVNIVVIGGSFAGWHLANRLTQSLPNGYRVVLVERTSHFNYTFNFPRYSVLRGREQKAFIPYTSWAAKCPEGSLRVLNGTVEGVRDGVVILEGGEEISFEFLAIATGSTHPLPAKVVGRTKTEGRAELKALQDQIETAKRIAVVGGGAVGVQLVGDIKDWYPNKEVTLIQSRERLLPSFGERLSLFVMEKLKDMDIRVLLGERPHVAGIQSGDIGLHFKNGKIETFDLVVRRFHLSRTIGALINSRSPALAKNPTLPSSPSRFRDQSQRRMSVSW